MNKGNLALLSRFAARWELAVQKLSFLVDIVDWLRAQDKKIGLT
jgi:hypothetical protein